MIKKGEKNQTDSFSPTRVKPIIPATHFLLLSLKCISKIWQLIFYILWYIYLLL